MFEEEVLELFMKGFDCGQAVLASAADELGIEKDYAYKIAAGFGGGLSTGNTCGAVLGAIAAIGMKYGHSEPNTPAAKNACKAKVLEFQERFLEVYPSVVCRELLGHDVSDPDELKIIMEKGLFMNFCPKVASVASEILEEILE